MYQQLQSAVWCTANSMQIQDHRSETEGYKGTVLYSTWFTLKSHGIVCNVAVTLALSVDVKIAVGTRGIKFSSW